MPHAWASLSLPSGLVGARAAAVSPTAAAEKHQCASQKEGKAGGTGCEEESRTAHGDAGNERERVKKCFIS